MSKSKHIHQELVGVYTIYEFVGKDYDGYMYIDIIAQNRIGGRNQRTTYSY